MGLPTFYLTRPDEPRPGAAVMLSEEDARHAARSLRVRPGDEIEVSDGAGWTARARLLDPTGAGELVEAGTVLERPQPMVTVVIALPKGDRAWWAVQKLTELGVDTIVVAAAERSVRAGGASLDRARTVAREAAKQSRRAFLPAVSGASGLLEAAGSPNAVLLYEHASRPLAGVLPDDAPDELTLIVGPEGGISPRELEDAARRGVPTASLGRQNLRTETAAVAAAAIALHRYGRLG